MSPLGYISRVVNLIVQYVSFGKVHHACLMRVKEKYSFRPYLGFNLLLNHAFIC
jgi:hypothetical protein